MIREAEIEDMERQWKAQNEAIMRDSPPPPELAAELAGPDPGITAQPLPDDAQPRLPLDKAG